MSYLSTGFSLNSYNNSWQYRRQFALSALPGLFLVFVAVILCIPLGRGEKILITNLVFPGILAFIGLSYAAPFLYDFLGREVGQISDKILAIEARKPATRRGFYMFVRYRLIFTNFRLWTYKAELLDMLQEGQSVVVVFGPKSKQLLAVIGETTRSFES